MNALKYLDDYYNNYDEEGRLQSQHGQVEYLTTMRYIDMYIQQGMRVLEVGAGTGRYSLALSEKGYQVDAVELIQHNIDIFKSKLKANSNLNVRRGNALDLSCYHDSTFDITLVLGPMYHLFDHNDKIKALSEAIRVTKKDGVVFVSYCMNDATIINWGFRKGNILTGLQDGIVDNKTFKCLSNPSLIFELYRKEEIEQLMKEFDVERLRFVATDLATNYMRETIDRMDAELF